MTANRIKGSDRGFSEPRSVSSLTAVQGEILDYDRANEILVAASASSTPESLAGVAVSAIASGDTEAQVQEICDGDEYIFDTTNNTSSNHNYHRMVLTSSTEVNNTGTDDTTDSAIVVQMYPVGAASDKKMVGRFVRVQDRA